MSRMMPAAAIRIITITHIFVIIMPVLGIIAAAAAVAAAG